MRLKVYRVLQEFCSHFFSLFLPGERGLLVQEEWFATLRNCSVKYGLEERKAVLVELLESVTYILCKDEDISLESFCQVR